MALLPFVASTMYIIFQRKTIQKNMFNAYCWYDKSRYSNLDKKYVRQQILSSACLMYNFKRTYQVSSVNGEKNEGKTCPNMCHESSSVPSRTIYIDSSLKKDCPYQPQSSQKRKTTLGMFDLKRQ